MNRVGTRALSRRYGRAALAVTAVTGLLLMSAVSAQAAPGPTPPPPNTLLPLGIVTPDAASPPPPATGTARTYRVYATREGLVGRITANGHKIISNDHFVSLPSTSALSAKGKNYYSVRVCSVTNGRCAYEPVWDVGPWNTHDDYWDLKRTSWTSLPTGEPESQAAYQNGYNGGKDQFGRKVLNPAGIDLADGTIHASLGLAGSGWVNVTYLWTGGGVRGTIATKGGTVNVRSGIGTSTKVVGLAGPYAQIPIECQTKGQVITRSRTSAYWYRMAKGNYISAAYVNIPPGSKIKTC
jgi:hypothetical protein